jgi:hypothetical protein
MAASLLCSRLGLIHPVQVQIGIDEAQVGVSI